QLGPTYPSHIIRTIEYWDNERKHYPQFDHTAVIVAEEITGRFMNVISLFNGNIPLIAIQVSAYKVGDDVQLSFTKILDRVNYGNNEEEIEQTDRAYWEKRSNKKCMELTDKLFSRIKENNPGIDLKYNKFYIGLTKGGMAKNFVTFKPHKAFVTLLIKTSADRLDDYDIGNLNIDYLGRDKSYRIRIKDIKEFDENRELLDKLIADAKDILNIEE
ncbi:MAG: hypothetical protein IKO32_09470, partial [Lachnospiraceae bacterium]|nr:hypothetical protein [Lachnospiraceae bacterium]